MATAKAGRKTSRSSRRRHRMGADDHLSAKSANINELLKRQDVAAITLPIYFRERMRRMYTENEPPMESDSRATARSQTFQRAQGKGCEGCHGPVGDLRAPSEPGIRSLQQGRLSLPRDYSSHDDPGHVRGTLYLYYAEQRRFEMEAYVANGKYEDRTHLPSRDIRECIQ